MTILVIDDSIIQLRIQEGLLRGKYDVIAARSGIEGCMLAKEKKPDLIILDYDMPVMDGRATFANLQEEPATADIPVIFLTAVNDREHIKQVIELGPASYLLKPVEQNRLLRTIEHVMNY